VIVGLVGLGRMGSAMAERLSANGFEVLGWDRNPVAVDALAARGRRTAPHARGVAAEAPVVITTITEDAGVRAVFTGPDGLLAGGDAGRLFVEMSTLQPATVRDLAPAVEARGSRIIDVPVLGTIPSVLGGALVALAGGDAADLARARPVLDVLARETVHLGPLGSGHAMKLAVNLGLAGFVAGLAESLALGEREGLKLQQMLDVLGLAPTANAWFAARKGAIAGERSDVTLDIRTLRKDMLSIVATGARDGVPMPLSAGVLAVLSAAVAAGWGERDMAALPGFLRGEFTQHYD
jgi:3-hydroxyisobutyrate dehydrogenase